MTIDNDHILIN